jgi:hypothetical protein
MLSQEDTLQFEDLYSSTNDALDLGADSKDLQELERRLIHTFLEWEEYNSFNCGTGWSVSFTICLNGVAISDGITVVASNQREAETLVLRNISFDDRFEHRLYCLLPMQSAMAKELAGEGEFVYKLVDSTNGEDCGTVIIEQMTPCVQ